MALLSCISVVFKIFNLYLVVFSKTNVLKASLIGLVQVVILSAIYIYCHSYIKQVIV